LELAAFRFAGDLSSPYIIAVEARHTG
jgi:hypothetical protein